MNSIKIDEILKSVSEGYNIPASEVKSLMIDFETKINKIKDKLELANNLIYSLQKNTQDLNKAKELLKEFCVNVGWPNTNPQSAYWPLVDLANRVSLLLENNNGD